MGHRAGGRAPLRRGAPGVPIRTARAGTARGVRHRTGRAVGARRRVGGGGARMGGRVERGTRAAPERGELARRGAGGAAGTDRARDPGAGAQTARAPARRRAAARPGPAERGCDPARSGVQTLRRRPRGVATQAGAGAHPARRAGPRRLGAPGGLERRCAGAARLGGALLGRHERGTGDVPGRGSVRRGPARRYRALGRPRPAAAASGRSLPGAGERVAAPRPRGLGPRRPVLAACGRASGNAGKWGGRPGRYPAAGGPRRGPAGRTAAANGTDSVRGGGGDPWKERGRACRRAGVGAAAAPPTKDGGSDRAPGAPDPRLPGERGRARGAPGAGACERSDSEVVRRREFLQTVGRIGGSAVGADLLGYYPSTRLPVYPSLLIPMDDAQTDHLKAYGVTYRIIQAGIKAEWLLNYRSGAFLVPDGEAVRRDAALGGVKAEPVDDGRVTGIRGEIEASNMDAVPLEKAPKVAVYVPPNAPPWDDAVTMALQYAGIPFDTVWDFEVMAGKLANYDWLHLHHEDFTGQYSKFFLTKGRAPWVAEMVRFNSDAAKRLGLAAALSWSGAVARPSRLAASLSTWRTAGSCLRCAPRRR